MAITTADYIDQLDKDKQTLVNNLNEKGVEASNTETFTQLAPKVLDVNGGSSSSNIYKRGTTEEMNSIQNAKKGDYCLVIKNDIVSLQEGQPIIPSQIVWEDTVTLPSAFTGDVQLYYNNMESFGRFDIEISQSYAQFRLMGMDYASVNYVSSDGITYTIDSKEDMTDGTLYQYKFGEWNDIIGHFIKIGSVAFGGLYQYATSDWSYANIGVSTTSDYIYPNKEVYTNDGVITGNLGASNIPVFLDLVDTFDTSEVADFSNYFKDYKGMQLKITAFMDTSKGTNMSNMFSGCSNVTTLDVSNFNTSKVTNMYYMFGGCGALANLNLSNFDTSGVTNMHGMFSNCTGLTLLDVSNFDTSNVTNMNSMFGACTSLTSLDVSNFNTSKVTDMYGMFINCREVTSFDLSNFDTSSVENISWMFHACEGLTSVNLSSFNTNNVTKMDSMFRGCGGLTSLNLSSFNTSNVTRVDYMFEDCSNLTRLDIRNFSLTHITDSRYYRHMFNNVPNGCLIIVKDTANKTWITSKFSNLTNIKTVTEYEAQ